MRNLKKILALVMALVMSMSLVTIANAADFTDNDDISYEEAADVMNAIGVIEGYEDGSFDPNGTLVREEAATLVTRMLLGDNAGSLGIERSTFDDVLTTRWSAPAIEYCVSLGIIDGAGDGNFYPRGQLTAVAFAKVLLTALGYDADTEGLVGTTWSVNTSALATEVGLDNGIEDLVWSAAITREEAAQMALNTIKAPLVAYEGGVTVIVGDTPVSFGSGDAYYVTTTLAREQRISDEQLSNSDDYTVEFGEKYFPRLRLIRETDDYERPSYTWVYENTELGTYVNYDLLVETYTEGVSGRTLFELLGRSTIQKYGLTYYVDGKETDLDKDLLVRSNTSSVGATGNGVLTQVFVDHDNEEIIITSINTYLAQAISDYSENNEYATLRVYTGVDSANQVQTRTYNVDVADVANVADVTIDTFYAVNLSYKYDNTYAEVAKIGDVEVMEDCSITGYSSDNGNDSTLEAKVTELTTGGEDYDANEKAFYDDEVLYRYDENLLTDNTYTIYLDQYGYFLGVELFEGSQNYVFITGFDRNSSNLSVKTATATGIFLDGQMKNIQVNVTNTDKNIERAWNNHEAGKDNALTYVKWSNTDYEGPTGAWNDLGKYGEDGIYDLNQWFTYTVNEDNVYTLKPAVRMTWTKYDGTDANSDGDVIIRTDNLSVENDFPTTVNNISTYEAARGYVYGNDDTIFLTVDLDVVDTTGGSRKAITEVNGVYTGVQNVDITVEIDDINAVNKGQVFTVYDSNGYAIAAVVIGEAQGATGNYAYILSEAKAEKRDEDGTYYWTFDAILDGEKQTLTAKGDYNSTIALIDKGDVVELRFDGDYVVDVRTIANENIYGNKTAYHNGGNIRTALNGEDIYSMLDLSATANVASLQLNTLYITANRNDRGLAIASGAKAVVIQSENNKEVITNCSSVAEAVSRLGDPNTSTTTKEYKGDIIAVLNSNGAAEWVVFVSDTPVGVGGGSYDQSGDNYTATAWVDAFGFVHATINYVRPDYVPTNDNVTVSFDVYADNQYVGSVSDKMGAGVNQYTYPVGGILAGGAIAVDPDAEIELRNVKLAPTENVIRYRVNGQVLTNAEANVMLGTSRVKMTTANTGNAAVLTITPSSTYFQGTYTYTISGANVVAGTGFALTGTETVGTDITIPANTIYATGSNYVTVDITVEKVPDTFGIDIASAPDAPTALPLSTWGIGGTDGAKTVSVSVTGAPYSFTTPQMFDLSNIKVTLSDDPDDVISYRVTIKGIGSVVVDSTNDTGATLSGTMRLDKDVVITDDMVSVSVEVKKMAIASASWDDVANTVTINFTEAIDSSKVTAIEGWVATTDLTIADGATPAGTPPTFKKAAVSGKSITLTFSGEYLAEGDTITLVTASEGLADVEAANSNACDTSIDTLKLGANGTVALS